MEYFRKLIQNQIRKKLIWKVRRPKGRSRIQIKDFPEQIVSILFPIVRNGFCATITNDMELLQIFSHIGAIHRDFLAHSSEDCGNKLCLLHCDRVAMEPPVTIKYTNKILKIYFWIKRIGAGGTVF